MVITTEALCFISLIDAIHDHRSFTFDIKQSARQSNWPFLIVWTGFIAEVVCNLAGEIFSPRPINGLNNTVRKTGTQ
jgi:hypothetical protein